MPAISRFFGIEIRMYYEDHAPPHFHAHYGESSAVIAIESLACLHSDLPPRAYGMILEWAVTHRPELLENWDRARKHRPLEWIEPLGWSMFRVRTVRALPDYRLFVEFTDGVKGEVDLSGRLFGPVFEPFEDPELFGQVSVDAFGAVCWPNGADLAPDALHGRLVGSHQGDG